VKWNLLRDAAVAGHTEEALVRVVVPVPLQRGRMNDAELKKQVDAADAVGVDISTRLVREVATVLPRT